MDKNKIKQENNIEDFEEEILDSLGLNKKIVRVFIGYSWVEDPDKDEHWKNFLQPVFNKYQKRFEERFSEYGIKLSVQRLRGGHAGFVYGDILNKIKNADILAFDIVERKEEESSPKNKKRKSKETVKNLFNPNVMMELGMAMALKKDVFLMMPSDDEEPKLPSDLNGFFYTKYSRDEGKFASKRILDLSGFASRYVWLLNKAANNKILNK